ncbi:YeeE/YedE family protein [Pseudaminobacter arsenicus]|uniref:YeeE/YedE family protein n=1 Tax=Borborobacter arsenicus TaxID=1851146 RepID=A0A432V1X7_9HYPH|nr:DUF6691 family protein [Pseudaminobacter arsenicus]RUM96108.1 YeeE/YedE family protein [Pseudaminobacter arsenicus]
MSFIVNLLLGLLFGVGLVISGMADPAKVLNFLDLAGTWDPSLAFVMGGAVIVAFFGYRVVLGRKRPLLAPDFQLPKRSAIDGRLVAGAAIFGLGWGLGGFCPGPALTSLGFAETGTLIFVPAMFAGMLAAKWLARA